MDVCDRSGERRLRAHSIQFGGYTLHYLHHRLNHDVQGNAVKQLFSNNRCHQRHRQSTLLSYSALANHINRQYLSYEVWKNPPQSSYF